MSIDADSLLIIWVRGEHWMNKFKWKSNCARFGQARKRALNEMTETNETYESTSKKYAIRISKSKTPWFMHHSWTMSISMLQRYWTAYGKPEIEWIPFWKNALSHFNLKINFRVFNRHSMASYSPRNISLCLPQTRLKIFVLFVIQLLHVASKTRFHCDHAVENTWTETHTDSK